MEARLLWMRERLAVESAEESREPRLHQMSSRQRERLTSLCLMHVVLSMLITISRVYNKREGEYPTPYATVQTRCG